MNKKLLIKTGNKSKEKEIKGTKPLEKRNVSMEQVKSAMIIDDDPDLSQILSSILEERGILVYVAHSLHEAESCLAYLKPSLIFLDNSFPEGLGVNFITKIRAANPAVNIVMITAEESDWIQKKAMEEGIYHFLKKPFSKKSIDLLIDSLERKA
jgi:two-component system, OmpR family, response regulator